MAASPQTFHCTLGSLSAPRRPWSASASRHPNQRTLDCARSAVSRSAPTASQPSSRSISVEFSQRIARILNAFADQIVDVAVLKVQVDNIAWLTANWKRLRQMSGARGHLVIGPEKMTKPKVGVRVVAPNIDHVAVESLQ